MKEEIEIQRRNSQLNKREEIIECESYFTL